MNKQKKQKADQKDIPEAVENADLPDEAFVHSVYAPDIRKKIIDSSILLEAAQRLKKFEKKEQVTAHAEQKPVFKRKNPLKGLFFSLGSYSKKLKRFL